MVTFACEVSELHALRSRSAHRQSTGGNAAIEAAGAPNALAAAAPAPDSFQGVDALEFEDPSDASSASASHASRNPADESLSIDKIGAGKRRRVQRIVEMESSDDEESD